MCLTKDFMKASDANKATEMKEKKETPPDPECYRIKVTGLQICLGGPFSAAPEPKLASNGYCSARFDISLYFQRFAEIQIRDFEDFSFKGRVEVICGPMVANEEIQNLALDKLQGVHAVKRLQELKGLFHTKEKPCPACEAFPLLLEGEHLTCWVTPKGIASLLLLLK